MRKTRLLKAKKIYLSMILLITSAGVVFFFPMNIGGQYTCFYHRIFDHSHPVSEGIMSVHHREEKTNISSTADHDMNGMASGVDNSETPHHGPELLDNYLHLYAFPWWTSVGLLAFCIYLLLKLKRKIVENDTNLTINQ